MSRYQISDSQTGRTMVVEGETPPTDADAAELFATVPSVSKIQPGTPVNQPGMWSSGAPPGTPPADNPDWDFTRGVVNDPALGISKDSPLSVPLAPFTLAGNALRAGVSDAMTTATGHPEYGGNLTALATQQPLPADKILSEISGQHPVIATAGKVAQGALATLPMMAAGMPEGALGRLVSVGFSADMVHAAGDASTQLGEEMGKPPEARDPDKITSAVASLVQSGAFAPLAGNHAVPVKAKVIGELSLHLLNDPVTLPAEKPVTPLVETADMQADPNQFPLGKGFQTPEGQPVPASIESNNPPIQPSAAAVEPTAAPAETVTDEGTELTNPSAAVQTLRDKLLAAKTPDELLSHMAAGNDTLGAATDLEKQWLLDAANTRGNELVKENRKPTKQSSQEPPPASPTENVPAATAPAAVPPEQSSSLKIYHGGPENALTRNWPKWWTTNPERAAAYGKGSMYEASIVPKNPFYSKLTLSQEQAESILSKGHDAIIIGSKENPIDVILPNAKSLSELKTPEQSLRPPPYSSITVAPQQWHDMAQLNDAGQMAKYGTTRAKLLHLAAMIEFTKKQLAERLAQKVKPGNLIVKQLRQQIADLEKQMLTPAASDIPPGQSATSTEASSTKVARGLRARKVFENETANAGPDILSWINDNMRMMSRSDAKATLGKDWWQKNQSLYDDSAPLARPQHNVIYGGKSRPDQVAQAAFDARVLKSPDVPELWRAITTASARRSQAYASAKHEEKFLETEAQQHTDWQKATAKGEVRVTADQLKVGETMEVEGERVKVTAVDPDSGDVTLEDGTKFGRQTLPSGATIHVEKFDEQPASTELFGANETPFNLTGEKGKFVEPTKTATAFGGETLTQHDMFAIADITKEVDPFKSANAAVRMYGDAAKAAAKIKNQLRVMDSDPEVKRSFTKEQRKRLDEVLNVLQEQPKPRIEVITDQARRQQILNSIAEGQEILRTGSFHGVKFSKVKLEAVRRQVAKELAMIGETPPVAGKGFAGSLPQLGPGGELGDGGRAPAPPADDNTFSAFNAMPMEMPEAVRVIKALTGVYPKVKERLGKFAGVFRFTQGETGKGHVEILASQFDLLTPDEKASLHQEAQDYARAATEAGDNTAKIAEERYQYLLQKAYEEARTRNPVAALKTMWHEIGHVVDWLPDHIIHGRGNLFGRIASIKNYLGHTLPFDPARESGKPVTPADKAALRDEAERQLREEMGPIKETIRKIIVEEPEWKITGVSADDIQNILRENAGKDTPELTRWFAEQSSKVKAEILRKAMRGLVDERLAALGKKVQTGTRRTEKTVREKVGREPTQQEIKQRFAELLAQEIRSRNLADLATVKAELSGLIAWWRGVPTIPDYFKTAEEMYADAFSVWANNPAAAAKRAPTYSEMLWKYLDRKPQVKALYDDIQRQIKSGAIMGERVRGLHEMWDGDDQRSLEQGREAHQTTRRDFYDNVRYHFDRRFGPIYKSAQGYRRKGEMKEAIANHLYRATEHERFLGALNRQVGKYLVENSLDWSHDLGEYLFHKRVIEERFNLANPLGFTPKNSLERLAEMQKDLGADRWHALEIAAQEWHALYQKHVVSAVTDARMFTPELNDVLLNRSHYATFAAIKGVADDGLQRIIDTRFGKSITPHIFRQIGNLGEIKNPATATVLKGLSLISAAYRNNMKREIVQMLKAQDPGNIIPAKTRWNGKALEPVILDNHPAAGTILYMQDGKPQAFYVRRVVADAVNGASPTENKIFSLFVGVNGTMKGLFTQLNYAFWPVNFVRDTAGFMYQMPGMPLPAYLKNLPKALAAARQSVVNAKPNLDADEALRRKLVISKADPRGVYAAADNEFELKVASFGMDPAQWAGQESKVGRIVKAWNAYRELGETVERVNKISGMLYLDEKYPNMPEWEKREIIRERSGSPNFLERGASNPAVDMLFLFYNPWKEGVRSVVKAARDNPFSFTSKALITVALPTILQAAAVNGYLGGNRKKEYASIPDYDLTNYLCVPLGWADEKMGKIMYLRFPLWEPARIAHGSLFQMLTKRGKGILSNAGGQLPGLNPIWQVGLAWGEYAMGQNPVDLSRGVNVMPDTTFKAGGLTAAEEVAKYSWNSLGGSVLTRFKNLNLESPPETPGEKFMALPVINNALGRWVKVSNGGLRDQDLATTAGIEQHRAQLRLAVRPIADKILNHEVFTPSERMVLREPYAQQYLHDILPDLAKSRASEQFRRLHDAPDMQAKAAIAKEMRK